MYKLLFFIFIWILSPITFACLWDSDTIHDEINNKKMSTKFDLVSGQIPHHGKTYYETRVKKSLEKLKTNPQDMETRNDLAVAYLRLKNYEKALKEFTLLEEEHPQEYKILSNLGIYHKKTGNFSKAIEYTERALKIKPEGHLGLGDYYLHMLRWRKQVAENSAPPTKDFLNIPYWTSEEKTSHYVFIARFKNEVLKKPKENKKPVDHDKITALIRADFTFADAYVIFGDLLCRSRDYNLGLWAFARAKYLNHPNPEMIDKRIELIFDHWRQSVNHNLDPLQSKVVEEISDTLDELNSELKECEKWLEQFKKVEGELVSSGKTVDFKIVEKEMENRGIYRIKPRAHGIVTERNVAFFAIYWLIPALLIFAIFLHIRKKRRNA